MIDDPITERAIRERGEQLLAAVRPERLLALSPAWWQQRVLSWATSDPAFRVALLRFVDVLPALRSASAVAGHVRQYFREDAPSAVRAGVSLASPRPLRPVLSRVVREGVEAMAGRFIAGATPEDAVPRLRELAHHGVAWTVDLLGEATLSDHEADAYASRYAGLLAALQAGMGTLTDAASGLNVSIKLSAFAPHFEPAAPEATWLAIRPRLLPFLESAFAASAAVNFDMEQYRFKDLAHRLFAAALREPALRGWPGAGIVVQAYLRDAIDDIARVERVAAEHGGPVTVRLVKGAYWDEETVLARQESRSAPVFEEKAATDENFERCSERLLSAYPVLRAAFATHNPRAIAQAMVRAERAGVPKDQVEFQFLYGMAEGLRRAVHDAGYRTRVYVPVGPILPGMAYFVRRLLENTSNESWLVHRHEEADPEDALRAPAPNGQPPLPVEAAFANQTPAELYLPGPREEFQRALGEVRAGFGRTVPLVIDGIDVKTDRINEVRAPAAPGTVLARVSEAGAGEVERAVAAANRAFPSWRDLGGAERGAILRRAADLLAAQRYRLAATMVFESGKPWREADGDVIEAIDFLRYYALEAERLDEGLDLSLVPGETNHYRYEARGAAAIIAPWNFPLAIICGMASGALAAGCTAILKPAEQSPVVAYELFQILRQAGVPPGAVQFLPGPGEEIGAALVAHAGVDVVAFTGSTGVGREIIARASAAPSRRGVRRVLAELGGKNAIIVDDDADLDQAVEGVAASAFGYAGQKCSACSRVVVVDSAYDAFRERLAAAVESLAVGPPDDPFTFVPPVISAEARDRIQAFIALGEAEGRLVARGPGREGGHYVAPHVFEGIGRDSRLAREEIFGPVLVLFRAASFDEALDIALDSDYALTGGVYSRNPRSIARARASFRVGNLYINRKITGAAVGRQPFAGWGASGTGEKAGGPDYLRAFMLARVVTENTMRRGFAPPAPPAPGPDSRPRPPRGA